MIANLSAGGEHVTNSLLARWMTRRVISAWPLRMSRLTRAATTQLAQQLDPLHHYLGMMPAVRKAIGGVRSGTHFVRAKVRPGSVPGTHV